MMKFNHPFHLVSVSPWPLMSSLSLLVFMMGSLKFFNEFVLNLFLIGLILILMNLYQWWRDVIRESTLQGFHSFFVKYGLIIGMFLFILSELMFFLSFFWSYFHGVLSPSVDLGSLWPSNNIEVFNPYNIPLLNTLILLSSGITITWAHYMMYIHKLDESLFLVQITIVLGLIFTFFQYIEYNDSFFSMSDSMYGSMFFLMTGFHGIHVLIGTLFIFICFLRMYNYHFSNYHHFGFEASSWYWHFVDVVWLFLYIFVYWMSY
uniref:Cytochrome c oxidase subunit 3 n=1 Tax=Paroligoneurus sp. QL-2014 TaxID=1491722 RepID=A0A0U1WEK7_9HYME|nr:cytochrome c oxidase subunit III [Paroligoneurus sp. QL-2014]